VSVASDGTMSVTGWGAVTTNISNLQNNVTNIENTLEVSGGIYGTTTGSATAYALAASGFALTDGVVVRIKLHVNTGEGPTLNVNSTGAKAIKYLDGNPLGAGIVAGTWLTLVYSSTLGFFILQAKGGDSGNSNNSVAPGMVVFESSGTFNPLTYGMQSG